MADINTLFADLTAYVGELSVKFVNAYIPADPSISPSSYALDVRAYCVLSHAAFEEYFEAVVMTVANKAVDGWVLSRKINDVIPALLTWHGAKLKIDEDAKNAETKPFDYLRGLLTDAKAAFSNEVFNNHGVSIVYLRKLLIPVAIEIKNEPTLLNSLQKLADGRGAYAHKGRVKTIMAPEDAVKYVGDILMLCEDVKSKALANIL
jgi:hypothetical protein